MYGTVNRSKKIKIPSKARVRKEHEYMSGDLTSYLISTK